MTAPRPLAQGVGMAVPPPEVARCMRIAAGMSQSSVARAAGVSRRSIIRWERGETRPSELLAARYATVLYGITQRSGL